MFPNITKMLLWDFSTHKLTTHGNECEIVCLFVQQHSCQTVHAVGVCRVTKEEIEPVIAFKESSWDTVIECVSTWKELNGLEKKAAMEFDLEKKHLYGYDIHTSCMYYNYIVGVAYYQTNVLLEAYWI